ncbi:hypothetical protein AB0C38_25230 [Amycolatopsis sp. NPDC048633]|uniref:hypothetical protein n=1 Tax=Amycolatopsis sp. NPDC048633 TaxID=3157095 RepID=UPI0033D3BC8C
METRTVHGNPPGTLVAAFFGYLVSTLSALVGAGLLLGYRDELAEALRTAGNTSGTRLTEDQIQHSATIAQAFGIAVLVVLALLYLFLSFKLKAGRNWARIVLTIVTLLQVASLLATSGTAVNYVSTAISVLALVLSYLPPSNAYVTQVKHGGA